MPACARCRGHVARLYVLPPGRPAETEAAGTGTAETGPVCRRCFRKIVGVAPEVVRTAAWSQSQRRGEANDG